MTKNRMPDVEESSLRALDAVVAAVIDADQRRLPPKGQDLDRAEDEWLPSEEVRGRVAPFKYRRAKMHPARQESLKPEPGDTGLPPREEEAGVDHLQAEMAGPSAPDPLDQGRREDHQDLDRLLSQEEERFIANIVGWLRPRPHKDVIIARIWTRLTESEPESFYAPEAEEIPAAENAAAADAGQPTGE